MKAIAQSATGGPEVLVLKELPDPIAGRRELLIQVGAAALNNADLLQRRGLYPPPPGASPLLGLEVAGTVVAIGDEVSRFKTGDRVMVLLAGGGYAEKVAVEETQAMRVPKGMNFESATAIPEAFLTAYLELVTLGKLQAGESVLIHAGASGVGTAAIQLACEMGAKVFVTAGSQEKLAACRALGAHVVINYKNEAFDERVHQETAGKGVDCVLDLVGAVHWEKNIRALAVGGRLLLVGMSGGTKTELNLVPLLTKRLQIIGSTLRARSPQEKAQLVAEFSDYALSRFAQERLKPVTDRIFAFDQVQEAHRYLETQANIGKVILSWNA